MTDLAQSIALEMTDHRAFTNTPNQNSGLLLLNQATHPGPVNVYVYTFPGPVAGFALSPSAPTFFTGGLKWEPRAGNEYSLFANFEFLTNTTPHAISITVTQYPCSAPYTPTGGLPQQLLAITPEATGTPPPSFTVNFSAGPGHDPEIVVTPIGGGDGGGGG